VSIEIRREDHQSLTEYAATPTAFEVREAIGPVTAGALLAHHAPASSAAGI
jgi:hypothetical protein